MPTIDPDLHRLINDIYDVDHLAVILEDLRRRRALRTQPYQDQLTAKLILACHRLQIETTAWYHTQLLDATVGELEQLAVDPSELCESD